jgi:hypothetical protein
MDKFDYYMLGYFTGVAVMAGVFIILFGARIKWRS